MKAGSSRARSRCARILVALGLLSAAGPASATMPIGSYTFEIGGTNAIWLHQIEFEEIACEGLGEATGWVVSFCDAFWTLDGKGKLGGSHEIHFDLDGGATIGLSGPVKGRLRGDGKTGITDLSLSLELSGGSGPEPYAIPLKASADYSGRIDPMGVQTGAWDWKFCAKGFGCSERHHEASPELLEGGAWTLAVDVTGLAGGKLGGTAMVQLGEFGALCPYTIDGRYSANKDQARLDLIPVPGSCRAGPIRLRELHVESRGAFEVVVAEIRYQLFGFRADAATIEAPYAPLP